MRLRLGIGAVNALSRHGMALVQMKSAAAVVACTKIAHHYFNEKNRHGVGEGSQGPTLAEEPLVVDGC